MSVSASKCIDVENVRTELHTLIMRLGLQTDSKHFVDQPCLTSWEAVAQSLRQRSERTAEDLRSLLTEHFGEPGSDLIACPVEQQAPPEWVQELPEPLKAWAQDVQALWTILHRRVDPDVDKRPGNHTLLPLPRPFIIPGDRFRECYYWDSYWSLRGLLATGQVQPAKDLVDNLLTVLERHGFVPNGARSYYLNRSQPPLLGPMVAQLYAATGDKLLLQRALPLLVLEHTYWTSGQKSVRVRAADGSVRRLSRYYADWDQPRPESLAEDTAVAAGLAAADQQQLFRDIASACESGWDFSTRWFADGGGLSSIRTTRVVPADLNGLLYLLARTIAHLAGEVANGQLQRRYEQVAAEQLAAVQACLWDGDRGCWRDVLLLEQQQQQQQQQQEQGSVYTITAIPRPPAASDYIPLWCGCAPANSSQAAQVCSSLDSSGLLQQGGLAATLAKGSGQQWDWPCVWPPLQHMVVEGLGNYCGEPGRELALELASRFLSSCYIAYKATGQMHEKYNAEVLGGVGSGGEYTPQVGFGWTNGVVLDLLKQHGKSINLYENLD